MRRKFDIFDKSKCNNNHIDFKKFQLIWGDCNVRGFVTQLRSDLGSAECVRCRCKACRLCSKTSRLVPLRETEKPKRYLEMGPDARNFLSLILDPCGHMQSRLGRCRHAAASRVDGVLFSEV